MKTYHMRYQKEFILKDIYTNNSQIIRCDLELQHLSHQPFIYKQRTLRANKEITIVT
jgi:hypothetical protein